MADAVSVARFERLTAQAATTWVLVGDAATLLSEQLQTASHLLTDHRAIGAELLARIVGPPAADDAAAAAQAEPAGVEAGGEAPPHEAG